MSKLKNKEIDYILEVYKKEKSIEKTVKITGFSKNTVNKYVEEISSKDKRSRNCLNPIEKLDANTGQVLEEYRKPSIAAIKEAIHPASICRCLKGELDTAGGFKWRYKNTLD
ncbi:hypothetical protein IRP63_16140 [Clostridium phage CWou-2020a]|uniref:Uncharacterized protein n=1 Tax=Clostridium botulinum C/D str. DC5 TaxID=1443128 RepID=A0A0A0I5I3_CLOBO|nr:hypothetical protein [Clostridium botulinum]QPW59449.1 hypothetical protein IRP63_16140 [Clostridium phage CWou-2020a]KGM94692.1 hypothetical protein Z955_14350 [Clostridium botulinum C/D str. DC5]KGM95576.1 hypothetical protein Z955_14035 [Clostridium botulinum C/D str. DC5]KOC54165.1 hypothetical protein ADU90_12540 [Clostridium botulinum]KOC56509.1 hypothetical protein ADU89_02550 [Clostridium botulinum]